MCTHYTNMIPSDSECGSPENVVTCSTSPAESLMQNELTALIALYPHYRISRLICQGGFGAVYLATGRDHREYAIKAQKHEQKCPMLYHEAMILNRLMLDSRTGFVSYGVPRVYDYLVQHGHEFLVMERLGYSLKDKVEISPTKRLSKKSALMIGIQTVRRLRLLHDNHVLHRDVKPGNLIMGPAIDDRTVYIVDFGVSQIVREWSNYNSEATCPFSGTLAYAPAEAFFRKQPTRAGDLQSLAYTLIEIVSGSLPWKYHDEEFNRPFSSTEIGIQKLLTKPENLCQDFPELMRFVKLTCRIKKNAEPDYDLLVRELESALQLIGFENDGQFDWMVKERVAEGRQPESCVFDQSDDFYDVPPMIPSFLVIDDGLEAQTSVERVDEGTEVANFRLKQPDEETSQVNGQWGQSSDLFLPATDEAKNERPLNLEMESNLSETPAKETLGQMSSLNNKERPAFIKTSAVINKNKIIQVHQGSDKGMLQQGSVVEKEDLTNENHVFMNEQQKPTKVVRYMDEVRNQPDPGQASESEQPPKSEEKNEDLPEAKEKSFLALLVRLVRNASSGVSKCFRSPI